MRYLTFALTKGRLANKTMEMFERAGITCEEMKDKDSRKLIFVNEELKMKFFLSKGPDVPTYVEYGAADIGVVGKDTIQIYSQSSRKSFFYKLPSHLECDRLIRSYATASPDCSKYIRPEKCSLPAYSI